MTATLTAPPCRTLRDYQQATVVAVRAEWAAGRARTTAVLATGMGKTDCIAKLATDEARAGGRVLIIAHRSELLDQCAERCRMHAPEIPVGRVQAATNQARHPITVAMAPTLTRAKRRARMARPTLVIVDEAHHAASAGYMGILRWAGCFDEATPTRLLGVTATLIRADKRGLGDVFESIAIERGIAWAVTNGPDPADPTQSVPVGDGPEDAAAGWLARPRGKVVIGEHLDLDNAKVRGGDYLDTELGELVAQDVTAIVEAWREHAENRSTVAFTPNVASAQALAEAFRAAGVPVGEVYGATTQPERRRIYGRVTAGELRVLVNVMVATEGLDLPILSCALMARPTKLPGLYAQMAGRVLRLYPGKRDALILDVVGTSRTVKLATLAELLPGADVDDVELDVRPCDRCGGYTCRKPAAVALAIARGMAACSCCCEDCGQLAAECVCGMGRDPDGGRRKLQGRARYAEVDLLALDEGGSDHNWLATGAGTVFLTAGGRMAVLRPGEGGAWSAVHVATYGDPDEQPIIGGLSLASTRVMVERWANEQGGTYGRSAAWRRKNDGPSSAQLRSARTLGIGDPESYTKGALSDLIDVARATRRFDRAAVAAPSWAVKRAVPLALADAAPPRPDDPRAAVLARARAWSPS